MTPAATAVDVLMPSLADGMESGTIIAWLPDDGATVTAGDELVEIETDKATMTVTAEATGVLHLVAAVGDSVPVGALIARIGSAADTPATSPTAADTSEPPPVPVAAPGPGPTTPDLPAAPAANGALRASPLARRIAAEHGIELTALSGSGPGGRIVRADVERAAGIAPAAPVAPSKSMAPEQVPQADAARDGGVKGVVTIEELTRLQQVVARRMAESKATAPEFVIGVEVDMEAAIALRDQLKAIAGEEKPPSYNDLIVKASALALREFPRANGAYRDGHFELFERINVGVAVAANDALVVPTIFDADRKSLGEIGRESRALAAKVRDASITPPELSGGTFTVSNLGMFGISEFIAVINPPQAAILSVGEMKRTPVEHDGEIALRHILKLKLSCDHRILYGAGAAGFLSRIRELLQQPLAMSL